MSALVELLREWMPHQRWFGSKGREWADISEDGFLLDSAGPVLSVHRVQVTFTDGGRETYLVPLSCLLYTSPSPRDLSTSRMPSSA